ncbi:hypothetical protein MJO28_008874, partial [Puccinia striiformis f. sp. tritici]
QLHNSPQPTILLGPPSSGKTALVRNVTSQLRADGTLVFHPLTIDLRTVDTLEHGAFLSRDVVWAIEETNMQRDNFPPRPLSEAWRTSVFNLGGRSLPPMGNSLKP